jgi:hypothetical protein
MGNATKSIYRIGLHSNVLHLGKMSPYLQILNVFNNQNAAAFNAKA